MESPLWKDGVDPTGEPDGVIVERGVLTDTLRQNRPVPWKAYVPRIDHPHLPPGPYPVVIWSHGLGGSRDGAAFLARFLAGQGYAVLNIQHPGTDSSLWEGKPGHPWDVMRATRITRHVTRQRFRDVPFVLDQLDHLMRENPRLGSIMDPTRIGLSGHSFGAMTTQVLSGQALGKGHRRYRMHDPRIRAAIAYSPIPTPNRHDPAEDVYGAMEIPMFFMTGTADESPIEPYGPEARLAPFQHAKGHRHLLILEEGDHMVFAGSRGQLGDNPRRATHEAIIRVASLAFWDSYLKDDKAAKNWLEQGGFAAWITSEGHHDFRSGN